MRGTGDSFALGEIISKEEFDRLTEKQRMEIFIAATYLGKEATAFTADQLLSRERKTNE